MFRTPPMTPLHMETRVIRDGRRVRVVDVLSGHLGHDGTAVGSCTMYDTSGAFGSSTVCAIANPTMLGE